MTLKLSILKNSPEQITYVLTNLLKSARQRYQPPKRNQVVKHPNAIARQTSTAVKSAAQEQSTSSKAEADTNDRPNPKPKVKRSGAAKNTAAARGHLSTASRQQFFKSENLGIPLSGSYIPSQKFFARLNTKSLEGELSLTEIAHFQKKLERGKIISGAGEGIKFVKSDYRKKELNHYMFKIKVLGEHGDTRVYGQSRQENRKVLVTFDHAVKKSHKADRRR